MADEHSFEKMRWDIDTQEAVGYVRMHNGSIGTFYGTLEDVRSNMGKTLCAGQHEEISMLIVQNTERSIGQLHALLRNIMTQHKHRSGLDAYDVVFLRELFHDFLKRGAKE